MRNTLRASVVGFLVVMMSLSPAMACHFCGGGWGGYYSYGPVYYSSYDDDGCCGGCYEVVDECDACSPCECGPGESVVIEGAPVESMEQAPGTPAESNPPANVLPLPAQPQQPAQVERPVEAPAPQLPPLPPQPAPTEPAPPSQPSNDLFNGTETPTPPPATETPAPEKPATETPAAPSDLFGTPAEKPAETPPPAEKPAETPPPATPPAASDDLFGTDSKPAETPAATEPKPAETPAATEGQPAEKPAEKPAGEEKGKAADDNIFGASPSILREAGGLASDEMREWVDNTGTFSCRGRLVRFLDGHVRLVKDNGRTTTVPLARLSASDLEFVNRQASAEQAEIVTTTLSLSAMPKLAN